MKKVLGVAALLALLAGRASAETYVTHQGQSLMGLALATGHRTVELVGMNPWLGEYDKICSIRPRGPWEVFLRPVRWIYIEKCLLPRGREVVFVSPSDVACATAALERMDLQWKASAEDALHYGVAYGSTGKHGKRIAYDVVLKFAKEGRREMLGMFRGCIVEMPSKQLAVRELRPPAEPLPAPRPALAFGFEIEQPVRVSERGR